MKVKVKFNLTNYSPDAITIESDNIETIVTVLRGIFYITGALVVGNTEKKLLWIEGDGEVQIAPFESKKD